MTLYSLSRRLQLIALLRVWYHHSQNIDLAKGIGKFLLLSRLSKHPGATVVREPYFEFLGLYFTLSQLFFFQFDSFLPLLELF